VDDAPDTVTDAVELLRSKGYDLDFDVREGAVACQLDGGWQACADAEMEWSFRFEGPSDPGDESIVIGIHWPATGRRGVLVSEYGYDTPPEKAEVLQRLTDQRGTRRGATTG
jgi:hypothetical protein